MFSLIKQLFIVLLSFPESLTTKFVSLNDEPCMVRPILIDLNPVEFKYYPFMINLDKCTGRCNVLSPKICVPKGTKYINVKAFNMIAIKNEAKVMTIHISVIVNANSITQHVIQTKNVIIKHLNVNVKTILSVKNIIVGILAQAFARIANI